MINGVVLPIFNSYNGYISIAMALAPQEPGAWVEEATHSLAKATSNVDT